MMSELTNKSEKELKKNLAEKQKAVREFRFNIAGSKLKDVKEGNTLKKDVARILTEINARKEK